MRKEKHTTVFTLHNEEGEYSLYVTWYCGDEEGYGVEITTDDAVIKDWSFGGNNAEEYLLSSHWYEYVGDKISEANDLPNFLNFIDFLLNEGDELEEDDLLALYIIKELVIDHFGYDPISPEEIANLGWQ